MKLWPSALSLLLSILFLSACGGGNSSKSTKSTSSSMPASSLSISSTLSSVSVSSVTASSLATSSPSSVSSVAASSNASSLNTQTGMLLDSAVAGIGYRTETQEGTTNSAGEYSFLQGETVIFFIGDLELPPVTAKGIVTPLDMANSDNLGNQIVINIARLLQSLDVDGDPENGISIPTGAASIATAVDFNVSAADFALNTEVTNLVANSGSTNTTLVSMFSAVDHLEGTLDTIQASLVGSWYFTNASDHIVLTFLTDGTYVIANDESTSLNGENGEDGFEIGSYTWNERSGIFAVSVRKDTNGEWGLSHPCEGEVFKLELRGDTLLAGSDSEVGSACDDDGEDATMVFTRVASDSNPIIGTWFIDINMAADEFAMFSLLANNTYMMAQNSSEDLENGMPGIERGTYTHNAVSNLFLTTTLTDTNDQWGLSDPCAVLNIFPDIVFAKDDLSCGPNGRDIVETLQVSGDTATFISEADTIAQGQEDPYVFSRVK